MTLPTRSRARENRGLSEGTTMDPIHHSDRSPGADAGRPAGARSLPWSPSTS